VLTVPLLQLTVLHPHVVVYERGLWLKPLLWSACWVPWDAVSRVEDHTLIHRGQRTTREKPQDGRLIVVETGLPRLSSLVGGLAGLGWGTRAFGIATSNHADYPTLLNAIQRHKGQG
jgi:hypothetical protein